MGNNVFLTTILVFLLVADVSNAAFLRNLQKLAASPPIEDPNNPGTPIPIPSPVLPGNQSRSVGGEEKGKENKQIGPPPATKAGKDASKDKQVTNDTNTIHATPPTEAKKDNNTHKETVKDKEKEEEKKEEEKEKKEEKEEDKKENEEEKKENGEEKKEEKSKQKEESKPIVPVGSDESCDEIGRRCQDLKSMTACVKSFDDSKALVIIQNKGNIDLKVDVSAMSSGSKHNVITVPKLQSNQVKMSLADGGINEIILNAGNGNCVLHLSTPVSQGNYFQMLPSYSKFITPTYGAYLVLVITLIAGGVLGCCWFSKRKGQRDIPYQELELSMPESAVAAETAEGWDEVWDDDWDEENAVRSPGGHRISANGLTARNSKKDDWEDWDD